MDSKSKLESCEKDSDSCSPLNCSSKIVINLAVPSESSGREASIVAEVVEVEENSTNNMRTLRIPPVITVNKSAAYALFELTYSIVRGRPVPIPGSGLQPTNISHVRDLSSMLTKAVENPDAASGNIFNCVSDRAVILDGMAKLCAKAAGLPVDIVHYDPKLIGSYAKIPQYALLRGAKSYQGDLGREASTKLPQDLKERYEEYVKIGRDKKAMKFVIDDKILLLLKVTIPV